MSDAPARVGVIASGSLAVHVRALERLLEQACR